MGLTMKERHRLTDEIAQRYRRSSKSKKIITLDEFVATTGYNRKYAIHLLAHWGKSTFLQVEGKPVRLKAGRWKSPPQRAGRPLYSHELDVVLERLWVIHNCTCGKILSAAIKANKESLLQCPNLHIDAGTLDILAMMSPATIDRRLAQTKRLSLIRGTTLTKPTRALRNLIPVRTFADWRNAIPGEFQADTVGHDGGLAKGDFCFSLNLVDVPTGWNEIRALRNRAAKWVAEALEDVRACLPFPFIAIHTDNGGEFINLTIAAYCQVHAIRFTRSRADKKNDNCYVECRNDDAIRHTVGYARYDSEAEFEALRAVYRWFCPYANNFIPTMRLISKERINGKLRKRYDKPKTPFLRLLESPDISEDVKNRLKAEHASFNLEHLSANYMQALARLANINHAKGAGLGRLEPGHCQIVQG